MRGVKKCRVVQTGAAGAVLLLAAAGWAVLRPAPADAADADNPRHVLVIGIDGCLPDAVQAARAPHLKALAAAGTVTWDGFSGGVPGTPSRQNTKSLPAWNSILTGVWANKHRSVSYKKWKPNHAQYPNMFQRLKAARPAARTAAIVTWKEINVDYRMTPGADYRAEGKDDDATTALAEKHIREAGPDLVFVQLDQVDGAGEKHGFSPTVSKYLEAVDRADAQAGRLVAAARARANEDWLVIVVTDHGGRYNVNKDPQTGAERVSGSHGGDTPEERKIFLIVSGPGVPHREVSPGPGIVAVAPTALQYLGIGIQPEWNLDGQPFGL